MSYRDAVEHIELCRCHVRGRMTSIRVKAALPAAHKIVYRKKHIQHRFFGNQRLKFRICIEMEGKVIMQIISDKNVCDFKPCSAHINTRNGTCSREGI